MRHIIELGLGLLRLDSSPLACLCRKLFAGAIQTDADGVAVPEMVAANSKGALHKLSLGASLACSGSMQCVAQIIAL